MEAVAEARLAVAPAETKDGTASPVGPGSWSPLVFLR